MADNPDDQFHEFNFPNEEDRCACADGPIWCLKCDSDFIDLCQNVCWTCEDKKE